MTDQFKGDHISSIDGDNTIRETRLWLTKLLIGEREIILIIDETGEEKKGKTTDYVTKQYIGNLGKVG